MTGSPAAAAHGVGDSASAPHVAVLFEASKRGVAALAEASRLAGPSGRLTVVAIAPQSLPSRCGGPSSEALNRAIRDAVAQELNKARELLGNVSERATFTCLVEEADPPLAGWAAAQAFDAVLLPARRPRLRGRRVADRLRRATGAEVRLVG